jgi:hypothetical protein
MTKRYRKSGVSRGDCNNSPPDTQRMDTCSSSTQKSRTDHTAPSPLIRAKVEDWKADFPTDWDASFRNELPRNARWHNRDWHAALEDVGDFIETESVGRDVYVVLVAVDQRLNKNPRGHGILARLGRGEEADVFHFPLPFRLHFEATIHAITNTIEIITSKSTRPATLYTVHYYTFKHALIPSFTEYGRDAHSSSLKLSMWPRDLQCAWLPANTDWKVLHYLKNQLKHLRGDQDFYKSAPYFRSLIRRRFEERWAEEHETIEKGTQWLKVQFGHCFARSGRRHKGQFYPFMPTPRRAAQLTYALTGHAPIGACQKHFNIRDDDECPTCDAPQTQNHVLSACRRYSSISLDSLFTLPDSRTFYIPIPLCFLSLMLPTIPLE